jgi:PKD repeat protein/N-acetylneuraminic acid mutarotase
MRSKFFAAFFFMLILAAPAWSATTINWSGFKSSMPQNLESSAMAVYNGKIYVFGGFLYDAEQNKTFIYDTAADAWTQGANLPTARYYGAAAEVGGKIYVIGGGKLQSDSSVSLTACEIYDPAANSWTTGTALPAALRGHSAVAANGKIYVLGGKKSSGYNNTVYEFDPGAGSWNTFSTSPFSAAYGGAVFSASKNKIYYIGGITNDTPSSSSHLGKAYSMSASTGTWDAGSFSMPFKTGNFGIALDPSSGFTYLAGGTYYSGSEIPYPDIQVFNTTNDTFSSGTLALLPSPMSRYNNSAAVIAGKLYLLGGVGVNTVDIYTIASGSWYQPNKQMNDGVNDVFIAGGAAAEINGKLYVADGGFFLPLEGSVYAYDPAANSWAEKAGKDPQPRLYGAYGTDGGKIVIADGMDGNSNVVNTAVVYDPALDSFSMSSSHDADPAILSAGAVHNGKLYLFGGRTNPADDQSLSAKLRIFDIAGSSFSSGPDLPFALEQAAAATIGDKIYIFGGSTLTAPDYMNKNVLIFDPATLAYSTGAAIPYPVYGSSVSASGTTAIVDSGYYIFYSANLNGFGGGPLTYLQVYDTQSDTFSLISRPYGKLNHGSAVIGTKYYSTAGEDGNWPSSRLDIADIVSSGCSFTCTASATPESGAKPLDVTFTASATGSGCSGSPSYSWNFGDAGTSTQQNPVHTYENDGSYNWSVTVTWGSQTCQKSGTVTVGGCVVTCEANVSATSGTVPLSIDFSASSTATGCASGVTYLWDFGDATTSTSQTVNHSYTLAGTYTYSLTATADTTITCTKTGTITASNPGDCTITCTASAAPTSGSAPLVVNFFSTATPANCSGTPSFLWTFGDSATSTEQNPVHTYTISGAYDWTLTVMIDSKTCSKSGSINATSQGGPTVSGVSKASSPFRLKIIGSDFVTGAQVLIDGVAVPQTKFKSFSYLIAKKGASLKALVPKGIAVKIKVKNPDGSESNEYSYTRQ